MGDNDNCLSSYCSEFYSGYYPQNREILEYAAKTKDEFYNSVFEIINKEPINELENMNENTKINTQNKAITAIKQGQYIIGSVDSQGNMSFANNPVPHAYDYQARAECKRLALLSPGKMFFFAELTGGEMTPTVSTISI